MSTSRLIGTTAVMAAIGALLAALSPAPAELAGALTHPQALVDGAGADTVVVAACAALAWLVWSWGALGLALTAATAIPGVVGAVARLTVRVLLPASTRRAAAVALGIGLGMGGPWSAGAGPLPTSVASPATAPDWPAADRAPGAPSSPAGPVPAWPDRTAPGAHVVVRGDCLWDIAAARLAEAGGTPSNAEIATTVRAWWTANADVIGPDPDLLLPGQVLRPPAAR
jgi:nucleoid-associated protein YgaU